MPRKPKDGGKVAGTIQPTPEVRRRQSVVNTVAALHEDFWIMTAAGCAIGDTVSIDTQTGRVVIVKEVHPEFAPRVIEFFEAVDGRTIGECGRVSQPTPPRPEPRPRRGTFTGPSLVQ